MEEIELPDDVSLAAIVRDGHVITPDSHMALIAGDELLFVATAESENKLRDCLLGSN